MLQPIPFTYQYYQSRSVNVDGQRCVNLYPEKDEGTGGKTVYALYGTPGLTLYTTLGAAATRMTYATADNRIFAAAGTGFFEVTGGFPVKFGTLLTDVGPVYVQDNGTVAEIGFSQLAVSDGRNLFIFNLSATSLINLPYDPATTYADEDVVNFGEEVYVSLTDGNVNNSPASDAYVPGSAYSIGDSVNFNGITYTSIQDANRENVPSLSPTWWQPAWIPAWYQVATYNDGVTPLIVGTLTFQDQQFITNVPVTRKVLYSAIGDGTNWDPLGFFAKEENPDDVIAVKSNGQDLWVLGTETVQPYSDTGDINTPWAPRLGALSWIGCVSPASVCLINDTFFWLGDGKFGRGQVFMTESYQPVRISTHAIEYFLGNEAQLEDTVGWVYEKYGHTFYVLSLQTANKTFCYDQITGLWHERAYLSPVTGILGRHRAVNSCFANGNTYIGDYLNGNLYILDEFNYTDNGDALKSVATLPHISKNDAFISLDSIQLIAEMGVGLPNGEAPAVSLRLSRDYGHTFGLPDTTTLGKQGHYSARAIWRRKGVARDFVPEISITDPVKRVFLGMNADITVGAR